jgi:hypothetical protein
MDTGIDGYWHKMAVGIMVSASCNKKVVLDLVIWRFYWDGLGTLYSIYWIITFTLLYTMVLGWNENFPVP